MKQYFDFSSFGKQKKKSDHSALKIKDIAIEPS